jgi:hypothetical protein
MDLFCIEKPRYGCSEILSIDNIRWLEETMEDIEEDILIGIDNKYEAYLKGSQNFDVIYNCIQQNLRIICQLIQPMVPKRLSLKELFMAENSRLLTISDIIYEKKLCDIALNEHKLDKINMNRLSDYIVINKLNIQKERQLSGLKGNDIYMGVTIHHYFENYSEFGIQTYRQICDLMYSETMQIYSNFDSRIDYHIMEIIKHAFCVHASEKLIYDFVGTNVRKINETRLWECQCIMAKSFEAFNLTFYNRGVINWKNAHYFCAYNSFIDGKRHLLILLYNKLHATEGMTMDSPSLKHDYSEIINNLNGDIEALVIEALIEIIFELREKFKYVYAKMFTLFSGV